MRKYIRWKVERWKIEATSASSEKSCGHGVKFGGTNAVAIPVLVSPWSPVDGRTISQWATPLQCKCRKIFLCEKIFSNPSVWKLQKRIYIILHCEKGYRQISKMHFLNWHYRCPFLATFIPNGLIWWFAMFEATSTCVKQVSGNTLEWRPKNIFSIFLVKIGV